jgi:hypothetical protein
MEMTRKELQVTSGPSAAGHLVATRRFKRSDIVHHWDSLSCGPLTSLAPLEACRKRRLAYWEELCPLPPRLSSVTTEPLRPDLVPLDERPDVLLTAEVVNVWLGVCLDDQLFLAWLLELASLMGLDSECIRVIQFDRHPGTDEPVMSVGQLGPEGAAAHPPPPAPLTRAGVADLRAAWAAITAPDPTLLLGYLETHRDSATVFHRAFDRSPAAGGTGPVGQPALPRGLGPGLRGRHRG